MLNIRRFSTEDGPGIRTTVFLKGCALRCKWCQNPESWSPEPQIVWYGDRCIGARHCLSACPKGALTLTREGMLINRDRCDGCGACAEVCPAGAIEVLGARRSVEWVCAQVVRDRPFYEESGGGVTLSGGDPLFQFSFSRALLMRMGELGLHRALDTAGYASLDKFRVLVELSDLILLDLKIMDSALHRRFTGVPVEPILRNAKWLGNQEKAVWIRTPIIPGFTASSQNISAIAEFIRDHMPGVARWDLLGFNNLCIAKWRRLGMLFACKDTPLVSESQKHQLAEAAKDSQVPQITWTGVTREAVTSGKLREEEVMMSEDS